MPAKKLLKRLLCSLLALSLIMSLCACGGENNPVENKKISVVCTLFPQYDFVREIAGDKVELKLLLQPGKDSHSYDPSPADMVAINSADLFIYTGENMEAWAAKLISSLDKSVKVLDISNGITLSKVEHHDEDEPEADHEEHDEHIHEFDPHIWTSPVNAIKIVSSISNALGEVDAQNADEYASAAEDYKMRLTGLDSEIRTIVTKAETKEIIFGGRFALHYFCEEYGITYLAAFDSCSTETEPSPATKVRLINELKRTGIPVVFYEELVSTKVAKSIADEVGAQILLFHSCHNVSAEDFAAGASYLSLMEQNAKNLATALGVNV